MRKQPAQIVTNKRSPVVHVSTEVPRPVGEAFEDIARANGFTKAELLRRLIQAFSRDNENGESGTLTFPVSSCRSAPRGDGCYHPQSPSAFRFTAAQAGVLRLEPVEGARTLPLTPREAHAMKTTSGWSAKLTRSIVLKDGSRLVT